LYELCAILLALLLALFGVIFESFADVIERQWTETRMNVQRGFRSSKGNLSAPSALKRLPVFGNAGERLEAMDLLTAGIVSYVSAVVHPQGIVRGQESDH